MSFSTTFWIYLILWWVIPAQSETPMPDVPFGLWWQLRKLDRLVNKAHRKLPPQLADDIQDVFDLVKMLATHFDDSNLVTARREPIRLVALKRFPALIRQFMMVPKRTLRDGYRSGHLPQDSLLVRLQKELELIRQELRLALDQVLAWVAGSPLEATPQTQALDAWRKRQSLLRQQLSHRAGADILVLMDHLEARICFLLERTPESRGFDLDVLEIRKIAFEYLPDAVDQYLRLPADMAREQTLPSGLTAEQMLREQLDLLATRLKDRSQDVFEDEARELMVHGRFLRDKFQEPSQASRLDEG